MQQFDLPTPTGAWPIVVRSHGADTNTIFVTYLTKFKTPTARAGSQQFARLSIFGFTLISVYVCPNKTFFVLFITTNKVT